MKALEFSLLVATATLAMTAAAHAQDASGFELTGNVGAATDYVFRGISQTDGDPQVFAGVDLAIGAIGYAGAWVSNVKFGNGSDAEFDLYGGVKPTLGPVALDLGVIYYGYADQPLGSHEDYWEFKAAGSIPAGPASVGAAIYYSPEFFGKTGNATYYEVNAALPIPNSKLSISGALGRQQVDGAGDYTTWNVGAGFALTDRLGFDLRYWDTDAHRQGRLFDGRVVLGVKAVF